MALVALKYHQSGTDSACQPDSPARGLLATRIAILRTHVRSKGTKNTFFSEPRRRCISQRKSTGKVTRGTIPYFHIAKHLALRTEGRQAAATGDVSGPTAPALLTYPQRHHISTRYDSLHPNLLLERTPSRLISGTGHQETVGQPPKWPNRNIESGVSQARGDRFDISALLIRVRGIKTRKLTL